MTCDIYQPVHTEKKQDSIVEQKLQNFKIKLMEYEYRNHKLLPKHIFV